jgi:hypothetical protein
MRNRFFFFTKMSERISHLIQHLTSSSSQHRIRQVALVVEDLEQSIHIFSKELGLNHQTAFHDPHIINLGLKNCVFNLGDQFLELVCPLDQTNTAYKQIQRRKGDGGYMVMLQTENLLKDEARITKEGFRTVLRINNEEMDEIHLHPKETTNCIVSFSQPDASENWCWGGPNWKVNSSSSSVSKQIVGIVLQTENLVKTLEQYEKLLNVKPNKISEEEYTFTINSIQKIKVQQAKDGRGDGLYGIEIEAANRKKVNDVITVCGLVVKFI